MNIHFDEIPPHSNILLVDGSYYCFQAYYRIVSWWNRANPGEKLEELSDTFIAKYKKTFVDNLHTLSRAIGISKEQDTVMFVGKDCRRPDIWRNEFIEQYKGTRDADRDKRGFLGGPLIKMAYDENLFIQGGAKSIMWHPRLEADDCIAITIKRMLVECPTCKIYVITSDKDYLQLASDRVLLYDMNYNKLTEQKSSTGDAKRDLFCKILMGDVSDNIPSVFPKCGIKTALKYYANPEMLPKKLAENEEYKKRYELNKLLVDFECIPEKWVNEFLANT
jgi:5'-3' exonuclease